MSEVTRILVGRRSSVISMQYSEHPGISFDDAVAKMQEKALDGKASSDGFEVIEVVVKRASIVRPVISAAEVTDSLAGEPS